VEWAKTDLDARWIAVLVGRHWLTTGWLPSRIAAILLATKFES
jgi:hypothetical protein